MWYGPAGRDRADRHRRLAGDAEVPPDPVDRPWPEPHAGDPPVEPVDPRVQLVADLERPVMGQRRQADLVADRPGRPRLCRAVDRRRAGIDHAPDLPLQRRGGLEDRQGPQHVDPRPEQRVGPAGRHLEPGQVEQVGHPDPLDRPADGPRVGHVPRHEVDPGLLVRVQQQVEPVGVLLQVEDPDLPPLVDQLLRHPRPDAAIAARHQHAHRGSLRGFRAGRVRTGSRPRPAPSVPRDPPRAEAQSSFGLQLPLVPGVLPGVGS